MALLGLFKIINMPVASRIWKTLGSNFNNFSQAICEFVDNAVSNFRGNSANPSLVRIIRITVMKKGSLVDVTVEDGGTGIKNLSNAMTLAGTAGQESPLNEHGYGLKHALAYAEGKGCAWEISTRTQEDAVQNRYQMVRAPYDFGDGAISGEYHDGWPGTLSKTGTIIHFSCPYHVFATLAPDSRKPVTFRELVAILEESLSCTYADILERGEAQIHLIWEDDRERHLAEIRPLQPQWVPGTLLTLPEQEVDLGGGQIMVQCRYGFILPSKENHLHYLGNMESSGVEIRVNGRLIEHGLLRKIWGRKIHPAQNAFLAQIDLKSDTSEMVPATKNAKNGFREEDIRLQALFKWIRANIELPSSTRETREQKLFRYLAEAKTALPNMTRVSLEEGVFRTIGLKERLDLYTCENEKITIYEGKVHKTKAIDVYQLRMYWDGCVLDGVPPDMGVLVAGRHPREVQQLIDLVNTQTGPDGRRYNFQLSTWKSEGIPVT